jgi:hypothetical protein
MIIPPCRSVSLYHVPRPLAFFPPLRKILVDLVAAVAAVGYFLHTLQVLAHGSVQDLFPFACDALWHIGLQVALLSLTRRMLEGPHGFGANSTIDLEWFAVSTQVGLLEVDDSIFQRRVVFQKQVGRLTRPNLLRIKALLMQDILYNLDGLACTTPL